MRKAHIFIILLLGICVVFTNFGLGSESSFFPLQIGNTWGFISTELPPVFYHYSFSVDDTIRIDNELYYSSKNLFFFLGKDDYYRIDSLGNFVALQNGENVAYFNFNMNVGDSYQFTIPGIPDTVYTDCTGKKEVTTFSGTQGWQINFFMHFQQQVEAAKYMHFQEGIGPVNYTLTIHDLPMKLQWAIIDGVLYGDTGVPNSMPSGKIDKFSLRQNYPNPFNATTKIKFDLPCETRVTLRLFDLQGKEVATLIDHQQLSGTQEVSWDAHRFSSGVYFYQLQTPDFIETRKLVLQK